MTILYFSATGNCLSVAKFLGGTLKSIPQLERTGKYEIQDDVIGIVSPVYNLTLPLLVKRYLIKAELKADYIFGILTYGFISGTSAEKLARVLSANGNTLHYAAHLLMADTYLPVFDMKKEIAKLPGKRVEARLAQIGQDIENRNHRIPRRNIFWRILSALMSNKMESKTGIRGINNTDRKYIVSQRCTGCKTCERICPVSNITVDDQPVFLHRCESCFSCIQNCPAGAIDLKGQRSEARFRNSGVSLKELIQANGR